MTRERTDATTTPVGGGPAPSAPDPYKWRAVWALALMLMSIPSVLVAVVVTQPEPEAPRWQAEAAALGIERQQIARGEQVYYRSCAVCHASDAEGIARLGKPLRNSAFVQGSSDEELFRLIVEGRAPSDPANTTGALMPARGAQSLSDEEIRAVVVFLRAIQDPSEPPVTMERWLAEAESEGAGAREVAIELTDHPGHGLFLASCAACHGEGGQGLENFGLPLTTSGFVRSKTDEELVRFIKSGRPMWDENNVTGLDMPPKGGNPAITDEELHTIAEYLRALQEAALEEG